MGTTKKYSDIGKNYDKTIGTDGHVNYYILAKKDGVALSFRPLFSGFLRVQYYGVDLHARIRASNVQKNADLKSIENRLECIKDAFPWDTSFEENKPRLSALIYRKVKFGINVDPKNALSIMDEAGVFKDYANRIYNRIPDGFTIVITRRELAELIREYVQLMLEKVPVEAINPEEPDMDFEKFRFHQQSEPDGDTEIKKSTGEVIKLVVDNGEFDKPFE